MFGGDDDPFRMGVFRQMHQTMHDMDRMMDTMMDPFSFMGMRRPTTNNMISDGSQRQQMQQRQQPNMLQPFGGFGLGGFGGIFNAMNTLQQQAMNDPNSHVFTQSTMMTFDEHGRPRVVEKSVRKSGDAREERRRYRDSEKEEVAIGHTLGDRTHIIEKKRDKDGNVRRQQKFVNLDEASAQDFDREFQNRARDNIYNPQPPRRNRHQALPGHPSSHNPGSSGNAPIITLPEEEEPDSPGLHSSNRLGGPVIREISEEEAESSISKRRRGPFGVYHSNNE